MKIACWVLFVGSALLLLCSVVSKFAGPEQFVLGYTPVAWWRASVAVGVLTIALKVIHPERPQ